MMKILYSCLSRSWGGLEMSAVQEAGQLVKEGLSVEFLCFPGSEVNRGAENKGIRCIGLKAPGYLNPLQIIKLSRLIKENRYELIHTHLSKDLWLLSPSLELSGLDVPLILTKRMGSSVVKKDFLHRWLYKKVNSILTISREIEKNVLETCPVTKDKVLLYYNGINLERFDPAIADKTKVRKEYKIADSEILIGMLARLSPGKGHEEFLYAAKKLTGIYNNLCFLIVGDPSFGENEYSERIRKLSESYELNDKLVFTGFRSDTPDVLAALDIFAFPSHSEAFGNALVEAMAMGKPSVATRYGGVLDIAVNGVTGYLFNRRDGNDLADKLKLLIDSPEKRIELGKAGRKYAIENFNLEKQTQKLIEFYRKVIID
jgi:glycosyltransferase involved in cell wall biosynthesis